MLRSCVLASNHCGKVGSTLRKGDAEMVPKQQTVCNSCKKGAETAMATRKGTFYYSSYSSSLSYDAVPQV